MLDLLEALMIFFFGLSWPFNLRKSYVSRTAKGKSLFFEVMIVIGYGFGIARRILLMAAGEEKTFIFMLGFVFYWLATIQILIDIGLYFRNVRLDREREQAG